MVSIWTGGWASGLMTPFDSWATGDTWQLKLNGHDRFAARDDTRYFTRTQVWQHHSGHGGFGAATLGAATKVGSIFVCP